MHRWRSHAWVCLRRRGKGGRRGEKSVGEGKRVEGGVYLALSAITVSGGGWGTEKESQAVLVLPGSCVRRKGQTAFDVDPETEVNKPCLTRFKCSLQTLPFVFVVVPSGSGVLVYHIRGQVQETMQNLSDANKGL